MKKYLLVVKIFLLYIVIYYYFIGKVEISGLFFKSTINKAIKQSKANNEIPILYTLMKFFNGEQTSLLKVLHILALKKLLKNT